MDTIRRLESEVRSYCRAFPTVFARARGAELIDRSGRAYLDFFAGAGALNYGHNHPVLKQRLLDYVAADGIAHSLDMATDAKIRFLDALDRYVLAPRRLRYKVMFPGPTGTNAVEAALKLARKVTGRTEVISFTNAFHGMTLGSLAATGNGTKRAAAGVPLSHVARAPYDGYFGHDIDTLGFLERRLEDTSSGLDRPAAIILETIQAEGGVNAASKAWIQGIARLARRHGALLIVDDIQVGCGRTGPFFSFEDLGVVPDIVCLSKSLSGFGQPLSVTLMRPDIDVWSPGEHNGTFRGNNLAFVTAAAALETFWADDRFQREVTAKAAFTKARLERLADEHDATVKGRGLILGLSFSDAEIATRASREAFTRGVIIETAGPADEVLKLLPPLTITQPELERGLDVIAAALVEARRPRRPAAPRQPAEPEAGAIQVGVAS